jgi:AcrR family transcriptional regulator
VAVPLTVADQRLRPRKEPRQPRGHDTRARILDAARRVFAAHGYSAGTTNRIAAEAGLSIGSLYQYFPNKDAILVQLVDAHIDDGAQRVERAMSRALAAHAPALPPLAELVGVVVDALVEAHATDRTLHRVLFEEAPRPPELLARLRRVEVDTVERVAALLATHPEVAVPDVPLAARMAVDTVESLVHRIVTDEGAAIGDDRFRAELVRLVVGYLGAGEGGSAQG